MAGAALASFALLNKSFPIFCLASFCFGVFNGFGTYYRFAAADAATPDYKSRAISFVMAGGVVAAVVGPNLANWTHELWPTVQFGGSYFSLIGVFALTLAALFFMRLPLPKAAAHNDARPLRAIASQGTYVVAVVGSALGYGVMAFLMTATPLAMHVNAHLFSDTAFVIEWHLLGMFAPSFFTGHLIHRFGVLNVMLMGVLLYIACVMVNLSGTEVIHFWIALTLVGVGWNFLFVGGTTLLTESYTEAEKAKAQGLNDFSVFTAITLASLLAGSLQHLYGWHWVNLGVIPLILFVGTALLWLKARRRTVAANTHS
jgi:MFS family permease